MSKEMEQMKEMERWAEYDSAEDEALICIECNEEFVIEAGEAKFFFSKGLTKPKRCKRCRAIRKATIAQNQELERER